MKLRFSPAGGGFTERAIPPLATVLIAAVSAAVMLILPMIRGFARAADKAADPVLATVGAYKITQQEVDDKVLHSVSVGQLYELRRQALDSLVEDYVVEQAAKKAGLPPNEYIKRKIEAEPGGKITETDARKFYDAHKAAIDRQSGGRTFDQIKPMLIGGLQNQMDQGRREELIAKLRAENQVKVMLEAPQIASAGHPTAGSKDAPVTIIEFSDFQCPYCRAAQNSLRQVREKYGDKVKLVYMDFPLGFHPHAMDAARAAQCASDQDKFWQYHDALFANQVKLNPPDLKATAAKLGLNTKQFDACFDKGKHDAAIRNDLAQGKSLGVTGTPTFFINGRELVGAQPLTKFSEIVDQELAGAKEPANQHEAKAN